MNKYNIIYADCPWTYNDKSLNRGGAARHYSTLSVEDLKSLPVNEIADKDCILFMWVTFPLLQEGLDVIKAWGFKYKTGGFVWVKKNIKKDSYFFGMGGYTRSNAEICLIATKGKTKRLNAGIHQIVDTMEDSSPVLFDKVLRHSAKPSIVRSKIVELMGDIPRVELFARDKEDGWDSIGFDLDGKDIRESLSELIN